MSATFTSVTASARNVSGKAEARRLRKAGQIPAIAYGRGLTATSITVAPKNVLSAARTAFSR
jgi:large subunit ribosomal protein L25